MEEIKPSEETSKITLFLISWFMFSYLDDCKIVPGYRTDHSGVVLKLNFLSKKGENAIGSLTTRFLKIKIT